jgi:hypothetical protein
MLSLQPALTNQAVQAFTFASSMGVALPVSLATLGHGLGPVSAVMTKLEAFAAFDHPRTNTVFTLQEAMRPPSSKQCTCGKDEHSLLPGRWHLAPGHAQRATSAQALVLEAVDRIPQQWPFNCLHLHQFKRSFVWAFRLSCPVFLTMILARCHH